MTVRAPTNLGEFRAQLGRARAQTREQLQSLQIALALEVGREIVVGGDFGPGTPVDKGFARASWFFSVGHPSEDQLPTPSAGERVQRDAVTASVPTLMNAPVGETLWWANNAEYIERLEQGWSQQAPVGMVTIVLEQSPRMLDLLVQRLFPQDVRP